MRTYKITLKFNRPLLGSQPADPEMKRKYIASKMTTGRTGMSAEIAKENIDSEIENVKKDFELSQRIKELGDKSFTIFHRDFEGKPSLADIQLRGFMKSSFAFIAKDLNIKELKKKAKDGSEEDYKGDTKYRDWIGKRVFFDRMYYPFSAKVEDVPFDRSIRVMTMQGPRVSIASSEIIFQKEPMIVELKTTDDIDIDIIEAIFERGLYTGLGQWSNAQWGSFTFEATEV